MCLLEVYDKITWVISDLYCGYYDYNVNIINQSLKIVVLYFSRGDRDNDVVHKI